MLSLRFGDALKVDLPKWAENKLCDVFWDGDMQIKLIDMFNVQDDSNVDFELDAEVTQDGLWITGGRMGTNWSLPLDPEWLSQELGL